MGGRESRNKGVRGEYLLRDHLRSLGYTSDRVPLSGAAHGAAWKGDVTASKDGKSLVFEMKFRKDEYKSIYELLDSFKMTTSNGVVFADVCIAFGYSLEHVLIENFYLNENMGIPGTPISPLSPKHRKTLRKLVGLRKLLGTADILVLKINNKPLLFVKYV
jgi:hypothetical protein